MEITESEIQALKAQEAKDVAVELLHRLEAIERGPISSGEVQVKELDFQLRLREAEIEDRRLREAHEEQIKQLELQIEQERTRCAETENRANKVREDHARVIERVAEASESLHTQLERATREYNLKIEQLETELGQRRQALTNEIETLEVQRDALRDEIAELTSVKESGGQARDLREQIDHLAHELRQEHERLQQQSAAAEFERTKAVEAAAQTKELELARLEAKHQKDVLQKNREAAEAILTELEMVAVAKSEWDRLHAQLQSNRELTEEQRSEIREQSITAMRREFNITRDEAVDVTDLYYREQAAQRLVAELRQRMEKLDAEIARMREHIEQEPQRIAAAVEASKAPVQNYIEQPAKR